jgi:hypothetical protein
MVLKLAVSSTLDANGDQLILKTVTKKTICQTMHRTNKVIIQQSNTIPMRTLTNVNYIYYMNIHPWLIS